MRKISLLIALFGLIGLLWATTPTPDVGNGRIRVLGNNLENYYFNSNTGRGDYTPEEIATKTARIAEAMLASGADIFAFCEVEAKPIVLQQLADTLNARAGVTGRYAAVNDGIDEDWDAQYNNNIKAGFIYRTDKVKPYGSNYPATNVTYYKNTMRIQAWEELATGERFTLSMNHFKAMSDDASKAKRVENANWLMEGLNTSYKVQDPDILIMGDLNAEMDEDCIAVIQNNNYAEQLVLYDANAYSYVYYSSNELIDHAFANETMASQITGAAVWHVNTSEVYYNRYSDHDAYLVAVNLGGELPDDDCQSIHFSETFGSGLGNFEPINKIGESNWYWYSNYSCAYINAYKTAPDEDWLVSPAFDFTNQMSGTIAFTQALGYGDRANYPNQCRLLISDNYTTDVTTANWVELPIENWSTTNFEWKDNSITIPSSFFYKNNIHFAFHYNVASSAPAWEIKNLTVQTVCDKNATGIEPIEVSVPCKKILRNGQLIIERDGIQYTITGQRLY